MLCWKFRIGFHSALFCSIPRKFEKRFVISRKVLNCMEFNPSQSELIQINRTFMNFAKYESIKNQSDLFWFKPISNRFGMKSGIEMVWILLD